MTPRKLAIIVVFSFAATATQAVWKNAVPELVKSLSVDELKHPGKDKKTKSPKTGRSTAVASTMAASTLNAVAPEIATLARGLLNSPERIFEFVKNNISYEHYYGSKKGSLMTLLESSGNDADQCLLLAELLSAAGYQPTFRQAVQIIPYDDATDNDFAAWTGLDPITYPGLTWTEAYQAAGYTSDPLTGLTWPDQVKKNFIAAQQFTVSRGWPSGTFGYGSDGTAFALERMWVSFVRDGVTYQLDPSFKKTVRGTQFPVAAAMGYDRSAMLAAAGGNAPNRYTISNINEAGLGVKLTEFTTNLVAAIKNSAAPHQSVEEFLGRQQIVQSDVALLATAPALPVSGTTYLYAAFPEDMLAVLNLTFAPNQANEASIEFPFAQLGGRRLSLGFSGGQAQLWADEDLILSTTVSGSSIVLGSGVGYPYGRIDTEVAQYRASESFSYALAYAFSPNGLHVRDREHKLMDAIRQASALGGVTYDASGNLNFDSISDVPLRRRCITETLNVIGLTWFYNAQLSERIIGDLNHTDVLLDHRIGRAGQEEGYYVDMYQQYAVFAPRNGVYADAATVFQMATFFDSANEHGVIERMYNGEATSTMKIMAMANRSVADPDRDETFLVDAGSVASVKPLLKGYDSYFLAYLDAQVANGFTFLLPENAVYTLGSWSGTAYVESNNSHVGMIISGNLNGGYSTSSGNVGDLTNIFKNDPDAFRSEKSMQKRNTPSKEQLKKYGLDPVDMSSGAFVQEHEDLSLGETEPRGLHLVRSYNSDRRDLNPAGLGWGWTHNYDMRATVRSAPDIALGESTPYDIAAYLVAAYTALDIYKSGTTAKEKSVTGLVAYWGIENLKQNAVSLAFGKESMTFVKQPNGAYQSPSGSTVTLTKESSGDYLAQERLGRTFRYSATEGLRVKSITDIEGKVMTFVYTGAQLSSVTDSVGRSLTFNFITGRLSSVADNSSPSRTVSYGSTDADGNLNSVTDPENKTATFSYLDRRISETRDPDNRILVQNFFDSQGRVERQRDQGLVDREWSLYWSSFRSVEQNPQGQRTTYFFDQRGRSIGTMNAKGERNRIAYDGANHIIETYTAKNELTAFSYDKEQNLVQITDPGLAVTKNTYDTLQRLTRVDLIDPTYPDSNNPTGVDRTQVFVFTGSNTSKRPDSIIDGRNVETRYLYEPASSMAAGKPTTLTKVSADGNRVVSFAYDARGMLSRIDSPNPTGGAFQELFSYDSADRVSSVVDSVGTVVFDYDPNGNPLTITEGSRAILRSYDSYGRVKTYVDDRGNQVAYSYYANGLLKTLTYPGNKTVAYSYDSLNRIETVQDWAGRLTTFVWSADGLLTKIIRPNLSTRAQFYDRSGQLLKIEERNPLGVLDTFLGYQYDLGGRVKSRLELPRPHLASIPLAEMTYDEDNRLKTYAGTTCVNDDDGNLTYGPLPSGSFGAYNYDRRNRLMSAGGVSYTYDSENNRVSKTEAGQTTFYVIDPHTGSLPSILVREKPDGTKVYYVYGAGLLLYEESINTGAASGTVTHYHYDNVGNTVALSSDLGTVVDRVEYSPFGTTNYRLSNFDTPFLFCGAYGVQTDSNGLAYMRARFYNARVGRFLNADPIGLLGGANWYVAFQNNPISRSDPSGLRDVVAVLWGQHRTSPGHVMIFEAQPPHQVDTSFFPRDPFTATKTSGPLHNFTLEETLIDEGKPPKAVFAIHLPDDVGAAAEVDPKSWTGRIVKPKSEERSTCQRSVVSIVPI